MARKGKRRKGNVNEQYKKIKHSGGTIRMQGKIESVKKE
jgi:hypothetical protein